MAEPTSLLLLEPSGYYSINEWRFQLLQEEQNAVKDVLRKFGYTDKQTEKLVNQCWWFEEKLCRELPTKVERDQQSYYASIDNKYTLEMLEARQGNYPLTTFLRAQGLAESESFILYQPIFLDALSKLYTEKRVDDMVVYYRQMLEGEEWLGEETRQKAVEKLEGMALRILYPDQMPDYSQLQIKPYEQGGSLLDANTAINHFESQRQGEKINTPIDRTAWDLTQQVICLTRKAWKIAGGQTRMNWHFACEPISCPIIIVH